MDISKKEITLLGLLVKSPKGASIGIIQMRLGVPISVIAASFRDLKRKGFVRGDGDRIFVTSEGRDWAYKNQGNFIFSGKKTWREVPERFRQVSVPAGKPYAPIIPKLSRSKFPVARGTHRV